MKGRDLDREMELRSRAKDPEEGFRDWAVQQKHLTRQHDKERGRKKAVLEATPGTSE